MTAREVGRVGSSSRSAVSTSLQPLPATARDYAALTEIAQHSLTYRMSDGKLDDCGVHVNLDHCLALRCASIAVDVIADWPELKGTIGPVVACKGIAT